MIASIISFIGGHLFDFITGIIGLFPDDPFISVIQGLDFSSMSTGLSWFAYIFPVDNFVSIGSSWVAAVLFYSAYKVMSQWSTRFTR